MHLQRYVSLVSSPFVSSLMRRCFASECLFFSLAVRVTMKKIRKVTTARTGTRKPNRKLNGSMLFPFSALSSLTAAAGSDREKLSEAEISEVMPLLSSAETGRAEDSAVENIMNNARITACRHVTVIFV